MNSDIIIYQNPDGNIKIDVRLEEETVWLTQDQMATLFGKAKSTINEHIKNVFAEGELDEKVVVRKFRITTQHGAMAGKTTLSNFLQNPVDGKFTHCTANWKNEAPLKALVYNKEFREQNFGKGKLNGVFTLGQATTTEIKVIEDKTEELKVIKSDGVKKRETLNAYHPINFQNVQLFC